MGPAQLALTLPASGVVALPGAGAEDPCDPVPTEGWARTAAGRVDLLVASAGPSGSGRYWTVTVGAAPRGGAAPTRGICLTTTTLGWRTLRSFGDAPLAWTADRDHDGRPELVLWSSFPLRTDASAAEFGLVAWVYEFDLRNSLAIDWRLSRQIADELAAAYRTPAEDRGLQVLRDQAAQALDDFAAGRCAPRLPRSR